MAICHFSHVNKHGNNNDIRHYARLHVDRFNTRYNHNAAAYHKTVYHMQTNGDLLKPIPASKLSNVSNISAKAQHTQVYDKTL